jgi:predicted DNA-binding transcriptional regulator YafY
MFEAEEIEALALGARVVAAFGNDELARAAGSALSRVEVVLPPGLRTRLDQAALFAPPPGVPS